MSTRSRARGGTALIVAIGITLAIFIVAFSADWRLPGLYMDAINPEYIIPGIFDPTAPGNRPWILPGNQLLSRFPVFTGTIYHGSTQLYFALPFMALFGADVATLRIVQGIVGGLIVLLMALYAGGSVTGTKRAIAAAPMALLALDPSFVIALRTQAYSCLFPLVPLLGAILLLRDWHAKPRKALRLFASGVLFGLSVFSYFVFAFFFPAVVWMLLGNRGRARLREIAAWFAGCAVGYLPFLAGMFLLERSLGRFQELIRWLRDHSNHLHVMGSSNGVADHLLAVYTDARGVVTGRWPWLMILQHHAGDVTGSLKAGLLIALPLLALALVRRSDPGEKRAIAAPLIFAASFLACATIFGERLDGHHYTAILPFFYAAYGGACALLWPSARRRASMSMTPRTLATASIAGALLLAVAGANAFNLVHFHGDLRASGGTGLYTDAIDRFASEVRTNDANATVYLPDWGHVMPFMFLTQARVAQIDSVDPQRIARETCAGKPQIVVFNGVANADKFDVVKQLAGQSDPTITVWSQRDGNPVFQSARFPPRSDCGGDTASADIAVATTEASDVPSISVTPAASSACGFLSPLIATVRWNAANPALRRVEVWLTPIGSALQPWIAGSDRGEAKTGAWALPGMKFVLLDPATMQHLAQTEIAKIPCPAR